MSRESREEAVELPSHVTMITRMLDDAEIEYDYYIDDTEVLVELCNQVRFVFDDDEKLVNIDVNNE